MGNKAWTLKLDWFGSDEFNAAKDLDVTSKTTGRVLGQKREYENFSFLRVYAAGHMVPYDQPEHALDMFEEWIGQN
jgi:cathepsin A (carboxypeptidase C)